MTDFTRRTLVKGATAAAAAGALAGPALLEWAKAWAQTAPWKPEKNAQLAMLRWKYFVQAEDDAFVALLDAFTKATGVKVIVTRESYEDVTPKAAVTAMVSPRRGPVRGRARMASTHVPTENSTSVAVVRAWMRSTSGCTRATA